MKTYEGANIRNVALVGHSHSGKTSLTSAMLFTAGATQRFGRVDEGTTVTDHDEEEISRGMSIAATTGVLEWGKTKINLIDTPGFNMFIHEAEMVLPAVDSALVVVDAVSGVEVVTERIWHYADKFLLPRAIVCTRMDRERADFTRVMDSLTTAFGRTVVPVQLPVGSEKSFTGVVDLVKMHAYTYQMGGNGKATIGPIPANMEEEAKAAHERLVELVAEGDDKLMEEFFEKGTIDEEHIIAGLHNAIREDKIFPVLFASGLGNMGTDEVLDFLVDYMPTAVERGTVKAAATANNGAPAERKISDSEPLSLYVFKSISDPFSGRISFFKVVSGVLKNDATVQNFNRGGSEKFAHLSTMQGKTAIPVNELHAGDIGAVAKLRDTLTGDSLGDKGSPIQYPPVTFAEPAITFAIEPKTRADEDKLSNGIHKLMEEDAMLRFFRDRPDQGIPDRGDRAAAHRSRGLEIEEPLSHRGQPEGAQGAVPRNHSRQGRRAGTPQETEGGHGQFGDCKIKMEPLPHGGNFEFVNEIFGGSIPKNYIPAVEKGIVEAAARGYLAGFPVVDFRVILYDGSYHDVDSNELSFKTAGRIAFRKAMEQAKPTLLEPIMNVEITIPDEFAGSIMGDLNSRRGRIQGMDNKAGKTVVKAVVPMSEMLTYGTDLTSMTQGRGSFSMEMDHYDYVPALQQEKIIAAAKAERGEVVEEEE